MTALNSNLPKTNDGRYYDIFKMPSFKTWGQYQKLWHITGVQNKTVTLEAANLYTADNTQTNVKSELTIDKEEDTVVLRSSNAKFKDAMLEVIFRVAT